MIQSEQSTQLAQPTSSLAQPTSSTKFGLHNLLLAQFGHRESILRAVDSRFGIALMLLLVGSAAICREYDGSSFIVETHELAYPFIVSFVLASTLFVVVTVMRQIAACSLAEDVNNYKRFLIGYWLTSPIAWFYAIPIETMTDELSAVRFNLGLLTLVSLWRVLLFSRIAAVLFNLPTWIMLCWIGPLCCMIAGAAMMQNQLRLVGVMGGIRLNQSEELMLAYQNQAGTFVGYAFWVLAVGFLFSIAVLNGKRDKQIMPPPHSQLNIGWSNWIAVAVVFLFLGFACAKFQPNLYNSASVNALVRFGKYSEACEYMKQRDRSDFPAGQFVKMPRREEWGRLFEVEEKIQEIVDCNPPDWIADQILDRTLDSIDQRLDQIDRYLLREPGELESLKTLLGQLIERGWIGRFSKVHVEKMQERITILAQKAEDSTVGDSEAKQN